MRVRIRPAAADEAEESAPQAQAGMVDPAACAVGVRAASAVAPKNHRLPPISPSAQPHRRSHTNSPLRIGTTQHRRPNRSAGNWWPSPKYASLRPSGNHVSRPGSPLKHAVVGHVSTF